LAGAYGLNKDVMDGWNDFLDGHDFALLIEGLNQGIGMAVIDL